ncbi:MAG: flagellin, partial [Clostridiaceae bacterium]|nr:flagellin [Clostridiaceae bacterium]
DAAGLSISEKMRSQIRGLTQATRNAQDGVSFIQTAEGALNEVSDMLTRIKELSVQVQNGTYSEDDKINIGSEMNALGSAITDIYVNTKFNGISVFGDQEKVDTFSAAGGPGGTALFVGALSEQAGTAVAASIKYGEDGNQEVQIKQAGTASLTKLTSLTAKAGKNIQAADGAASTGTAAEIKTLQANNASAVTVGAVEAAITEVNTTRANYGAQQNQLEHAANNLSTTKENLQSAESRVRDVDMAEEMMEYTKNNILMQAAQSMLAQANSQPQGVLQLLQ